MDVLLEKHELAILKWIYDRARGFGKDNGYWSNALKKELDMGEQLYRRSVSSLQILSLVGMKSGEITIPEAEGTPSRKESGEWIWLTGEGIKAYRQAVPKEEWDIVPDYFGKEDD